MALILASASPRRRQLLADAGVSFVVETSPVVEAIGHGESPEAYVRRLAREKAAGVARSHPEDWVLAADTEVVLDGRVLGKPRDSGEAVAMLASLSGRCHGVMTAFALLGPSGTREGLCRTEVCFRALSGAEIRRYVATGEPMDKAGAYGIQGGAAHMVESIRGSYTNVVGLPMAETLAVLCDAGVADIFNT